MTISLRPAALTLILAAGLAPQAFSAGFQLREQSPSAQGNAFAGVSAGSSDISSMFFNPATMTQFNKNEVVAGASLVAPSAELRNAKSSVVTTGPSTSDAGYAAVLPSLYAMWNLSPDLKLGFSVNVPFGMATKYDSDFVGRFHAIKSDLQMIDLSPSIAYRINSQWSVGAAFVARNAKAQLTNAVSLYSLGAGLEGFSDMNANSWGYGYRLGVTWQPTPALRVGLGYQSSMMEKLRGNVSFQLPSSLSSGTISYLQNTRGLVAGRVGTDLKLPSTLSLGVNYDLTKNISIQAEASRTNWSCFGVLDISLYDNIDAGRQLTHSTTQERWRDTYFVSLGTTWKASDAWTFRAGLAHDQSACNDTYRTPRIPDCDRTWVSVGAGYAFTKALSVDVALTHIFCKDEPLNVVDASSKGNLSGTYKNRIEIASASVRYRF